MWVILLYFNFWCKWYSFILTVLVCCRLEMYDDRWYWCLHVCAYRTCTSVVVRSFFLFNNVSDTCTNEFDTDSCECNVTNKLLLWFLTKFVSLLNFSKVPCLHFNFQLSFMHYLAHRHRHIFKLNKVQVVSLWNLLYWSNIEYPIILLRREYLKSKLARLESVMNISIILFHVLLYFDQVHFYLV